MRFYPYDVIITNVWRPNDATNQKAPLTWCKVHYFDFPDQIKGVERNNAPNANSSDNAPGQIRALELFNIEQNLKGAAGFALADMVLAASKTDKYRPEIIFFSGANARVARPTCGYTITNNVGILLNSIVSILGQRRFEMLTKKPWESNDGSATKTSNPQD